MTPNSVDFSFLPTWVRMLCQNLACVCSIHTAIRQRCAAAFGESPFGRSAIESPASCHDHEKLASFQLTAWAALLSEAASMPKCLMSVCRCSALRTLNSSMIHFSNNFLSMSSSWSEPGKKRLHQLQVTPAIADTLSATFSIEIEQMSCFWSILC